MQLRYGTVTTETLKLENIKAEGKMSKIVSVRARVKEYLEKKTPLSLVTARCQGSCRIFLSSDL
jgi:hypothetical protein